MPPKRKADEADVAERASWSSYTVAELKDELKTRGLLNTGKKADLVSRLEAHDRGEEVKLPPAPKRTKKAPSPDVEVEGPLAQDVIIHKETNGETGERRLRGFVSAPDTKFKDKLKKIRKERMFMLDRSMGLDKKGHKCQIFDIAGSTGNIYKVTIGRSPNCDCMDAVSRPQT
jgi:hypothetical protein